MLVLILALLGRAAAGAGLLAAYMFFPLRAAAVIEGPSGQRLGLVNVAIVALACVLQTWFTVLFAAVFAVLVVGLGVLESLGLAHWKLGAVGSPAHTVRASGAGPRSDGAVPPPRLRSP